MAECLTWPEIVQLILRLGWQADIDDLAERQAPGLGPGAVDWLGLRGDPKLVPDHGQIRLVFAARPDGGLYLAYCSPALARPCARIDFWRVGWAHVMVVPGSQSGQAGLVALASAPGGRLWVGWFDAGTSLLHAVRTNKAATRPSRFSHRTGATVTFTVTDAGDPVGGAPVSCIGKHATTNGQGRAKLRFAAGTPAGTHTCSATMTSYQPGRTTIKVR